MNPLECIRQWIESVDKQMLDEIIALGQGFYIDNSLTSVSNRKEKITNLKDSLSSTGLSDNEIMRRILFAVKWIDFIIQDYGTRASWTKSIDNNLDARNRMDEEGKAFIDKMLSDFPERQKKWSNLVTSWNDLLTKQLTDKNIKDWYWDQIAKRI